MVSTVNVLVFEFTETFPAASVAVACTEWLAADSAVEGVNVHAPEPLAVVVPARTPSTYTETVALASAVPLTGGLVLLVNAPVGGRAHHRRGRSAWCRR